MLSEPQASDCEMSPRLPHPVGSKPLQSPLACLIHGMNLQRNGQALFASSQRCFFDAGVKLLRRTRKGGSEAMLLPELTMGVALGEAHLVRFCWGG